MDVDLENEESVADFEGNYIDDDVYDLSIKKESEELRQQELLIEEEVKHVMAFFCNESVAQCLCLLLTP